MKRRGTVVRTQITDIVSEVVRVYASRPMDTRMLRIYYDALDAKLVAYTHFIQVMYVECQSGRPDRPSDRVRSDF